MVVTGHGKSDGPKVLRALNTPPAVILLSRLASDTHVVPPSLDRTICGPRGVKAAAYRRIGLARSAAKMLTPVAPMPLMFVSMRVQAPLGSVPTNFHSWSAVTPLPPPTVT